MNPAITKYLPSFGLLVIAFLLSLWSYILVDPNLLLLNQPWWFELQNWFWQGKSNWQVLSGQYLILVLMWWGFYLLGTKKKFSLAFSPRVLVLFLSLLAILWLGHNALSHDIFNYLFNAKMVVEYGADPHVRNALEFAYDPWVRFMHNSHTPAPYGYGWTAVSLVPYLAGFGTFLLAYLAMKAWMVLGLGLYLWFGWKLLNASAVSKKASRFWLFALNPVLLWETALNGHNDVWMMWPALAAFWVVISGRKTWSWLLVVTALMVFSISIKLVTVVLVPVLIFMVLWPFVKLVARKLSVALEKTGEHFFAFWPEYASLLLLVPLVTQRSQQFLPWYLIWAWSFFPLLKWQWLRWLLLALAFTSQLRYLPWLLNGLEYSDALQVRMRIVTWLAVVVMIGLVSFVQLKKIKI